MHDVAVDLVEMNLSYRPGDPVEVEIRRRDGPVTVTDHGAAIGRADRPAGWRAVADRIQREHVVNVSRQGAVWLPVVAAGPGEEAIVRRIAAASLAFYQDLLDLSS